MNIAPPSGLKLLIVTLSVSIGTLLISLDQFIVNVAIPTIAGELGVSQDNGTWVVSSYVVANAIMVPLTGWLTSLFGRVHLFCISAILFAIASFLCGLATSFGMLIGFRILQGLVSGSLVPLSQSLLLMLFPNKRGFAMGMWGLVVMVGPAMGPVVGGWIIDNYDWPWLFYINVPLGILAGLISFIILYPYESAREKRSFDMVGIILLALTVCTFQIMIDRGNDDDWWRSNFIISLTVISIISFCFFLVWEFFHPDPAIDLSFFKKWNFTLGSIIIGFTMWVVFGTLIVTPIWTQAQLGYTPLWAGYVIAPFGLTALIFFPLVGLYLHIMDPRLWIIAGFVCLIIPYFFFAYLSIWTSYANIAWPRLFQGVGFALLYVPLTTISLAGIPEKKMPSAAGVYTFVRMMFLSAGITLNTTYFSRRENFFQSRYVESVIPYNQQWEIYRQALEQNLGLTGLKADAFIYKMVMDQAYTETYLEMNYLWGWGCLFLLVGVFFFKSPREAKQAIATE